MKKLTGAMLIIIIVLLLGVIGVGSYFFVKEKNNSSKEIEDLKNQVEDLNKVVQNKVIEANTNNAVQTTTELTTDELKKIEEYLNKKENNGFVSYNLYKNIDEINLGEVFYNNDETVSQAEIDELLNGQEQMTDIFKVTTSKVKEEMYKKTGKKLNDDEIKNRFKWKYLSKYDAFYNQHGDTNYMTVKCQSGNKTSDGTYKVILTNAVPFERNGSNTESRDIKNTLLTVKKEGDSTNTENSEFYGVNAGVLTTKGSTTNIKNCIPL